MWASRPPACSQCGNGVLAGGFEAAYPPTAPANVLREVAPPAPSPKGLILRECCHGISGLPRGRLDLPPTVQVVLRDGGGTDQVHSLTA